MEGDMSKLPKNLCSLLLILGMLFISAQLVCADGTSGIRVFASDAEAIGKGGAFVGEADNASAVLYNPAGMTQLKEGGGHLSLGMAAIQPMVEHTTSAGVETQARIDNFYIPHVFYVNDFGLKDVVFGFGTTSSWGLGTSWADDSFSRYHATNSQIENIDTMFTGAYQVNEKLSLGGGVMLDYSKMNKEKQVFQGATNDGNGQLKGDDGAVGYSLGALYKLNENHQFGLTYKSEMELNYEGSLTASGLNDAGGTTYSALFGGSYYNTKFQTDVTIPQSIVLGYSFTPDKKWRFNFDIDWTDWSALESENVTFPDETNATRVATLKALTDSDRDWKSVFSYQLGGEYNWSEALALRAGYFYNPTPIPEENFDTSIPIADVHGVNLGFGYDIKPNVAVNLAWTGLIYENITADNDVGTALTADLDGTYENFTNLITLTLNWDFD